MVFLCPENALLVELYNLLKSELVASGNLTDMVLKTYEEEIVLLGGTKNFLDRLIFFEYTYEENKPKEGKR